MRPNKVKALWRENRPVTVGWMGTADPYVAETLAHAGFDAIVLDMQHGMAIGPDRAALCFQAISTTDTVPFVRVPWNDPALIQYVLDAGAYGVIVPLVMTVEDARRAAGACRYPPLGYRSVGPNRARLYGGADYVQRANEEIACLVMIEHIAAVERVEEIAQVPGIDGFFIGPADLALSLGLPPGADIGEPRHVAACQRVLAAARSRGLVAGIACSGPEEARRRIAEGFNFNPIGSDIGFIAGGAQRAIRLFQTGAA